MGTLNDGAVAWAAKRSISRSTLEVLGAESGTASMPPDGHRCDVIMFPYRRGGEVVNWKARAIGAKAFKQKTGGELRFFNLDTVLGGERDVVYIVEGEMDAAALVEAGIPLDQVLSVPNGAPARALDAPEESDRYRYVDTALGEGLAKAKKFVLAGDSDAPGLALRHDLARLLGHARCWFIEWPATIKDANEFLTTFDAAQLREYVVQQPRPWPVDGLYSLLELPEPTPLEIWSPGFAEWELKLAFAPTLVSVCTGHPGHGKTTLTAQVWYQIARDYGIAVAMASFETTPKPHQRRNFRQFMFGRPERELTEAERAHADQWNAEHFLWLVHPKGRPTLAWVLDRAEVAIIRHNVRALVIDPWNKLESGRPPGMSETDYIGQCLDEVMDFARTMNVHVMIIAHPAKTPDPRYRGQRPVLEDIAGSKHWDNKPDLGLSVHRPKVFENGQRMTEADLYVLKSRFEETGYPCRLALTYDLAEGRYKAADYRMAYEG